MDWQSHGEGGKSGHVCATVPLVPAGPWVEVAVPSAAAAVPYGGSAQGSLHCHNLPREDGRTSSAGTAAVMGTEWCVIAVIAV